MEALSPQRSADVSDMSNFRCAWPWASACHHSCDRTKALVAAEVQVGAFDAFGLAFQRSSATMDADKEIDDVPAPHVMEKCVEVVGACLQEHMDGSRDDTIVITSD